MDPSKAPSAGESEKINEVCARVMLRSRLTGRKKTANPWLKTLPPTAFAGMPTATMRHP